jgi:Spy/CpxP family protein refolding chaperone
MLGFLIGTACLIGLIKVLRGGSCSYGGGYGYGGGCGHGSRGRWGGGPWSRGFGGPDHWQGRWGGGEGRGSFGWGGQGFILRALLEQLDATPAQEKVIAASFNELREELGKSKEELRKSRADIAQVMRGQNFDEVLFGELFARHDAALESMRRTTMGALGKVHVVLDEKQRARLADLIEHGPGFFRPFRSHGYEV